MIGRSRHTDGSSRPTRDLTSLVRLVVGRLPPPRDEAALSLLRDAKALALGRRLPSASPRVRPQRPPVPGAQIWARPGSFSSPIVNVDDIEGPGSDAGVAVDLPGIELDLAHHARVWQDWVAAEGGRWAAGVDGDRRYRSDNRMFGRLSARLLACALLAIRPRRYVEIGSGFSSAVALDVNDEFRPDDPMRCTFIEPAPDRLHSILRERDRQTARIIEQPVQRVDPAVFAELGAGDVLFVDSSHVLKTESDLCLILFEVLPRLAAGVYVHFHDIQYPFDYPMTWIKQQNRSWNEAYALRAFLMYNQTWKVHFWCDYFSLFGHDTIRSTGFEEMINSRQSSIWLTNTD
jgi:hypothetical protein